MLKIWGRATSSNVQKVLWTCAELGVPFERVDWGGPFGGNKDPHYLALNPNGLVPTVEDGELVIWESNTIMRYLCAKHGGERLHPAEPARRTDVERWMDWQLSALTQPMAAMLLGYYRTPEEKRDPAALEASRLRAIDLWRIIEQQLGHGDYLAGPALTLADICVGIWAYRWHAYPIERPSLPRLKAWYERLGTAPGFATHVARPLA
ncbi:MAG TPA: glutathione S-transferase family protein [Stellaceae bacterium]|nr:glutathione S-transferase family protein [Stellaceae bacterium]